MKKKIRILLADDHPVYLDGLCAMIARDPRLVVVDQVGDGRLALQRIRELKPDVALLDVNMPLLDGMGVARAARREKLPGALVFLTMHHDEALLREAIALGVRGYLLKESAAKEVVQSIYKVIAGEDYLSPAMAGLLMRHQRRMQGLDESPRGINSLAASEKRVLRLIASDRTSKEIAEQLGLSVRTVENHRARICKKLGVQGVHSLVKYAFEHRDEL